MRRSASATGSAPLPTSSVLSVHSSLSSSSRSQLSIPAILILVLFSFIIFISGVSVFKTNKIAAAAKVLTTDVKLEDLLDLRTPKEEEVSFTQNGHLKLGEEGGRIERERVDGIERKIEKGEEGKLLGEKRKDSIASTSKNYSQRHENKAKDRTVLTALADRPLELLSTNCPATSDVRGNLGPASVITNESVKDWLKDRWQAAKDMSGTPILGEHWLEVDLTRSCFIHKILIDWESAFSDAWTIRGFVPLGHSQLSVKQDAKAEPAIREQDGKQVSGRWVILARSSDIMKPVSLSHQHVVQTVEVPRSTSDSVPLRFIKLEIHRPSRQWGSSVWRIQIWGKDQAGKGACKPSVF